MQATQLKKELFKLGGYFKKTGGNLMNQENNLTNSLDGFVMFSENVLITATCAICGFNICRCFSMLVCGICGKHICNCNDLAFPEYGVFCVADS